YYASTLSYSNVDLSTAMSVYDLYSVGFFNKISNFDDANYNDSIFITTTEKGLLLDVIEEAELLSEDTRYQTILDSLKGDINEYENKTFSYVKGDGF
ncbi:MAG: hypothetical protein ACYC1Q_03205, partial [Bacteroidia bacterium]